MKIIVATMIVLLFAAGCMTTQNPVVEPTKSWEGHYFTVEAFQKGTNSIALDKNESIWVISNKTLSRVLKNCIQSKTGK